MNPCAEHTTQPSPFPVDLTAGTFTLTWEQKSQLLDGQSCAVSLVTEDPVTRGIVEKIIGIILKYYWFIPTLSQWGVIVMIGLLLTAGTIVFRRHRVQPI